VTYFFATHIDSAVYGAVTASSNALNRDKSPQRINDELLTQFITDFTVTLA